MVIKTHKYQMGFLLSVEITYDTLVVKEYLCPMIMNKKSLQDTIDKLGISKLNQMQTEAYEKIFSSSEIIILSPTGTGKTLAFLLPLISLLDQTSNQIQALILVPSRELAIQIEQVAREMGSGYKINAVYGGRSGSQDKEDLIHSPAILIGTPGRVADHIRRGNIETGDIHHLILDEFDKSLEVGFENEMRDIMDSLRFLDKKILTSATQKTEIPRFIRIKSPVTLDYLNSKTSRLRLKTVISHRKDKLIVLERLLRNLGEKKGIIFCSLKDTIEDISYELNANSIDHITFHGSLEQIDRERSLIKFRNGTRNIMLASDLAARGIDVPELDYIIHFDIPTREDEFIHRNGRTARMNSDGTAYIIQWENENLPDFIKNVEEVVPEESNTPLRSKWETIHISGGRKDKISKGDIAGLFLKQGKLNSHELGLIELKKDHAYVSVPVSKVLDLIKTLNNSRLKKKKVRLTILK